MQPLVIYHKDCTDGFGAAFAAWLKLGTEAEYLPMAYNADTSPDKLADMCKAREVYILDFSFPKLVMQHIIGAAARVVWLDHHKTAFEMWCPKHAHELFTQSEVVIHSKPVSCHIVLDNNKSGALLAWEYFHQDKPAPELIKRIDDRDRWVFEYYGSREAHAALSSYKPWTFEQWAGKGWASPNYDEDNHSCGELIKEGAALLRAQDQAVRDMAKQAQACAVRCGVVEFPGLAVNANLHHSELGHELANESGTYGLIWYVGQDGRVRCSLRSNGGYDVSEIAKYFGGGGHKNAAGFEISVDVIMRWFK